MTKQFFCVFLSSCSHFRSSPCTLSSLPNSHLAYSQQMVYLPQLGLREKRLEARDLLLFFLQVGIILCLDSSQPLPSDETEITFHLLSSTNPSACLLILFPLIFSGILFSWWPPLSHPALSVLCNLLLHIPHSSDAEELQDYWTHRVLS